MVIIGVYFGQLPSNFSLWLQSCSYNSSIDFFIIGENNAVEYALPSNVFVIRKILTEIESLAKEKIGPFCTIPTPYKMCDYKPTFGILFEEYTKSYDFWGHCDFDTIWGDIRSFLSDDTLSLYDKFFPLGHLSIYRNTPIVNNSFKLPGSSVDYKTAFSRPESFYFDELECLFNIYIQNCLPLYFGCYFSDISIHHERLTECIRNDRILGKKTKNYHSQVFLWDEGKIYRVFCSKRRVLFEEKVYIHLRKRVYATVPNCKSYYITANALIEKLNDPTAEDPIFEYNKCRSHIHEKLIDSKLILISWIITPLRLAIYKWIPRRLKDIIKKLIIMRK
jgi:hypothetical protein